MTARHLAYALPREGPQRLVLLDADYETVVDYEAVRSFLRIERDGRWWRLAGQDRATGEMVYLEEVELD